MVRFTFKKGLRFIELQRMWTLLRRHVSGKLQLEDQYGELISITEEEILKRWRTGQWLIDEDSLDKAANVIYFAPPRELANLPERDQKVVERRLKYIQAFQGSGETKLEDIEAVVLKTSSEINDDDPPSASTIWRWATKYRGTKCVTRLIDGRSRSGRRKNDVALEIFFDVVSRIYLTPEKKPVTEVYSELRRQVISFNEANAPALKCPSKATLYRWISTLEQEIVDKARLGAYATKRLYRPVVGQVEVHRILERVEVDHSPIDILVIDEETGLIRGKPWITAALDRYSRMILGFYICFHEPSTYSIMNCLKHAIDIKTDYLARYPDIKEEWPCYGIPDLIASDNGMDLHSDGLRLFCQELGTQQLFCPAKEPEYKGAMERWFRTYSKGLIHQLPGTVFSNVTERGDYDSEGRAAIDINVLTHLITKWIVEVYHCQIHRSLRTTPLNKWKEGLQHRAIELPAYPQQMDVLVGIPTSRTLFKYGVELENLRYQSDELERINSIHGVNKKLKLQLKYYEDDVSYIQVFDPFHKVYVRANAVKRTYSTGLPRDVHQLIIQTCTQRGYDLKSEERLLEVKKEIQEIIEDAKRSKRMADRKRSAKLRGIDSQNPPTRGNLEKNATLGKTRKLKIEPPPLLDSALDDDLPDFSMRKKIVESHRDN